MSESLGIRNVLIHWSIHPKVPVLGILFIKIKKNAYFNFNLDFRVKLFIFRDRLVRAPVTKIKQRQQSIIPTTSVPDYLVCKHRFISQNTKR